MARVTTGVWVKGDADELGEIICPFGEMTGSLEKLGSGRFISSKLGPFNWTFN